MNNFISLKILDKFKFLYEKLGVDYDDMRLIVSRKLTIDSRKTSNLLNNQNVDKFSNQYKTMQVIYGIIGFFMMIIIIYSKNIFISMSVYFSMIMFLMITIVMSDFSTAILDVKDKAILAIRGISSKTLNAAKVTHVMIYMINISIALSGFSLIASMKYGLTFFLVFLIEICLIDIFMIIISGLVYLIILKLFDGEKLKDAMNIIQVAVTLLFSVAYIGVMNISESMHLFENIDLGTISYFLPPLWFAAPLEIIVTKKIDETLFILSFLALVVPVISVLIYTKFTPVFEKNLQKLNKEGSTKKVNKYNLTMKLSKLVCRNKEERVFFNFISRIIKNDRDFKSAIYTTMGSNIIFSIYIIFRRDATYTNPYMYLFLYFYVISIPTIIIALKFSRNYKASYIYTTIPIKDKMNVHKAAIKACLFNIIIPSYLILCIIFIYFYKVSIIKHIIVVFLVSIFITISTFKIIDKSMPFSKQINVVKKNYAIVENYLMIVLVLIMAGIHFVSSIFGVLGLNIYIVALLIINIFLFKSAFKAN
ncbi:MAG: hypothetical protein RR942_13530 [Romboutsia sp.]